MKSPFGLGGPQRDRVVRADGTLLCRCGGSGAAGAAAAALRHRLRRPWRRVRRRGRPAASSRSGPVTRDRSLDASVSLDARRPPSRVAERPGWRRVVGGRLPVRRLHCRPVLRLGRPGISETDGFSAAHSVLVFTPPAVCLPRRRCFQGRPPPPSRLSESTAPRVPEVGLPGGARRRPVGAAGLASSPSATSGCSPTTGRGAGAPTTLTVRTRSTASGETVS